MSDASTPLRGSVNGERWLVLNFALGMLEVGNFKLGEVYEIRYTRLGDGDGGQLDVQQRSTLSGL